MSHNTWVLQKEEQFTYSGSSGLSVVMLFCNWSFKAVDGRMWWGEPEMPCTDFHLTPLKTSYFIEIKVLTKNLIQQATLTKCQLLTLVKNHNLNIIQSQLDLVIEHFLQLVIWRFLKEAVIASKSVPTSVNTFSLKTVWKTNNIKSVILEWKWWKCCNNENTVKMPS